ncbi:unnamed protein product [Cyprideis torosa]|uniref:Uncharacterized protein n=1 Tax=Cyprideis torosa TaxID=163714 RepID=A0A7R8ZHT7_9CRUS|nr:unnamed protein product [Cyprideis torosa]CAG0883254.1 unnamed protein product [Cyprideis torosa]
MNDFYTFVMKEVVLLLKLPLPVKLLRCSVLTKHPFLDRAHDEAAVAGTSSRASAFLPPAALGGVSSGPFCSVSLQVPSKDRHRVRGFPLTATYCSERVRSRAVVMSVVNYKFKSSKDYDTITFDGLHISIGDIKKEIMDKHKLGKGGDFHLSVQNAQSKDVYNDDSALISKNTNLIVSRVPVSNPPPKRQWYKARFEEKQNVMPVSVDETAVGNLVTNEKLDLASMEGDETAKIRAAMKQGAAPYDPANYIHRHYQRGGPPRLTGPVPPEYICYRCNKPGHWIFACPERQTLGKEKDIRVPRPELIKRSTGIPRSHLVPADPQQPGALMTAYGDFVVPETAKSAYENKKVEKPPFLVEEAPPRMEIKPKYDPELLCPICEELKRDAVTIACCAETFCDECIRNHLLESETLECPSCKQDGVSPANDLLVNRALRKRVNDLRNQQSRGFIPLHIGATLAPPPAKMEADTTQPPTAASQVNGDGGGDNQAPPIRRLPSPPRTAGGATFIVEGKAKEEIEQPSSSVLDETPPAQAPPPVLAPPLVTVPMVAPPITVPPPPVTVPPPMLAPQAFPLEADLLINPPPPAQLNGMAPTSTTSDEGAPLVIKQEKEEPVKPAKEPTPPPVVNAPPEEDMARNPSPPAPETQSATAPIKEEKGDRQENSKSGSSSPRGKEDHVKEGDLTMSTPSCSPSREELEVVSDDDLEFDASKEGEGESRYPRDRRYHNRSPVRGSRFRGRGRGRDRGMGFGGPPPSAMMQMPMHPMMVPGATQAAYPYALGATPVANPMVQPQVIIDTSIPPPPAPGILIGAQQAIANPADPYAAYQMQQTQMSMAVSMPMPAQQMYYQQGGALTMSTPSMGQPAVTYVTQTLPGPAPTFSSYPPPPAMEERHHSGGHHDREEHDSHRRRRSRSFSRTPPPRYGSPLRRRSYSRSPPPPNSRGGGRRFRLTTPEREKELLKQLEAARREKDELLQRSRLGSRGSPWRGSRGGFRGRPPFRPRDARDSRQFSESRSRDEYRRSPEFDSQGRSYYDIFDKKARKVKAEDETERRSKERKRRHERSLSTSRERRDTSTEATGKKKKRKSESSSSRSPTKKSSGEKEKKKKKSRRSESRSRSRSVEKSGKKKKDTQKGKKGKGASSSEKDRKRKSSNGRDKKKKKKHHKQKDEEKKEKRKGDGSDSADESHRRRNQSASDKGSGRSPQASDREFSGNADDEEQPMLSTSTLQEYSAAFARGDIPPEILVAAGILPVPLTIKTEPEHHNDDGSSGGDPDENEPPPPGSEAPILPPPPMNATDRPPMGPPNEVMTGSEAIKPSSPAMGTEEGEVSSSDSEEEKEVAGGGKSEDAKEIVGAGSSKSGTTSSRKRRREHGSKTRDSGSPSKKKRGEKKSSSSKIEKKKSKGEKEKKKKKSGSSSSSKKKRGKSGGKEKSSSSSKGKSKDKSGEKDKESSKKKKKKEEREEEKPEEPEKEESDLDVSDGGSTSSLSTSPSESASSSSSDSEAEDFPKAKKKSKSKKSSKK